MNSSGLRFSARNAAVPICSKASDSRAGNARASAPRSKTTCTKSFRCPAWSDASWRLSVKLRTLRASRSGSCAARIAATTDVHRLEVVVERVQERRSREEPYRTVGLLDARNEIILLAAIATECERKQQAFSRFSRATRRHVLALGRQVAILGRL